MSENKSQGGEHRRAHRHLTEAAAVVGAVGAGAALGWEVRRKMIDARRGELLTFARRYIDPLACLESSEPAEQTAAERLRQAAAACLVAFQKDADGEHVHRLRAICKRDPTEAQHLNLFTARLEALKELGLVQEDEKIGRVLWSPTEMLLSVLQPDELDKHPLLISQAAAYGLDLSAVVSEAEREV